MKKTISILLALAMAATLTTAAFADAPVKKESDGTITFTIDDTDIDPDGPYDPKPPTDPTDPKDPPKLPEDPTNPTKWNHLESNSLDFGYVEATREAKTYNTSTAKEQDGVTSAANYAGIVVASTATNWELTVGIGKFTDATDVEYLQGFNFGLSFVTGSKVENILGNDPSIEWDANRIGTTTISAGGSTLLASGKNVAGLQMPSYYGANYDGVLSVPANASQPDGTVTAELTWSYAAVPA